MSIIVVRPDRCAGNDPEAPGLALHQGPSFINAYCQAATHLADKTEDCQSKILLT